MEKMSLKPGSLLCPVPTVMVTCGNEEEKNIITIGWTGIINTQPPITYISVRKSRHSHDIIEREGEFVINLTTEALAFATDFCGVKSGKDVDKFKEMKLTPIPSEIVSCPMIGESPVNLECKVTDIVELGSHYMFIADITAINVDESLLGDDGKLHLERAKLSAFAHGEYFEIGKKIGNFGCSVKKKKSKKNYNNKK